MVWTIFQPKESAGVLFWACVNWCVDSSWGFKAGRGKNLQRQRQEWNLALPDFIVTDTEPGLLESAPDHFTLAIFMPSTILKKEYSYNKLVTRAQQFATCLYWDFLQSTSFIRMRTVDSVIMPKIQGLGSLTDDSIIPICAELCQALR